MLVFIQLTIIAVFPTSVSLDLALKYITSKLDLTYGKQCQSWPIERIYVFSAKFVHAWSGGVGIHPTITSIAHQSTKSKIEAGIPMHDNQDVQHQV